MKKILAATLALALLLSLAGAAEVPGPSDWAAEGVSEAVELGMVPEGLQSDWQRDLTRGEFAQLLVQFLAAQYGYGNELGSGFSLEDFFEDYPSRRPGAEPFSKADYLTAEENTPDSFYSWRGIFSDRVNVFEDVEASGLAAYINLAYLLGVVKGRDASHYDPDGPITRQEAAALLARTYGVYGTLEPKAAEPFTDADAIASWAAEDVAAMASWDILHGDETRAFSPLAHYTREQGVLTFLRLYKNMPVSRYNGTLAPLLSREDVVERCMSGGPNPKVLFQGETELCTVLCMSYGGVMHPPEPTVFLIYPDSTYKRIEVPGSPQDFHLTDHTLTFATGYAGQRNSLDLTTGTLTEGPVSETDQPHNSPEAAMTILPGETYQCLLLNDLDEDWYQVTFPQDGTAEFTLSCESPADAALTVYLYQHADSNYFPMDRDDTSQEHPQVTFTQDVKANKPYFVRVSGDSGAGSASYTLRARLLPPSEQSDETPAAEPSKPSFDSLDVADIDYVDLTYGGYPPYRLPGGEVEQLVACLKQIDIGEPEPNYMGYDGLVTQMFVLYMKNGETIRVSGSNPVFIVNGAGYHCDYETCHQIALIYRSHIEEIRAAGAPTATQAGQ